ncbi:ribosomal L1 domain-containing protein 1-like [Iris pallida]|uniref:Ribosomal L1 domain-containing protein 1-like n=1 Tax=Iris pallida TaxID=29817 RepID=A0AAX6IGF9_IRIPA|nr:ribosomal L1 domain-containing protein 1-like [Iris pallida]
MAPPTSPSPNPTRVKPESATRAVDALLAWTRTRLDHQKAQLFEPDDLLYLLLTLHRIPSSGRTNPYRIHLPHPLHPFDPQSTSICLLADDPQSESIQTRIRDESLPISTVIGLSDLRSDYRPYESRRKLADSYDLFFADRKILPLLPRLLGSHFFKKKKIPLAVDLSRPGWPQQVRAACESTLLYLRTGTACALKVGRVTMGREEIVRNVMVAIEGAVALVPRKWGNVRSMHLKFAESPALPIYEVVPEIGLKIEGAGKVEDEGEVLDAEEEEGVEVKSSERKRRKKERIHDAEVLFGDEQAEMKDGGEKTGDDEVDGGGDLSGKKKKKTKKKKDGNAIDNTDDSANQVNKKKTKKSKAMVEEEGERSGKESKELSAKKDVKKDDNVNTNAVDSADLVSKKKEKKKSKAVVQDGERSGNDGEDSSAMKRMHKKKKKDADDSAAKLNTKKSKAVNLEKSKRSKVET